MSRQPIYQITHDKFLSPQESERLRAHLVALYSLRGEVFRDALMIDLALHTGARASEILGLKFKDFSPLNGTLFVKGLKNSNDRVLTLPKHLVEKLSLRANRGLPTQSMFDIGLRQFERIWADHRPVAKKLHALRHTFAIELYKRTQNLKLVQLCLGHRNIMNTMVYLDFCYSEEEMKKMMWG